ncbi:MAG: hypothetical protein A3G34_06540 [Candidatus Lindowbacteria bacterium RIFCSPLOWO2_12_FULL_62_27]|nr:MAG: hypothetical protein A3G34_06540 [Candidatus Lindowbacteria bacterium RIFCSPLOWO2_12_FULL_62_27]OGH63041.1 MAG: hypothetical protein A3I06_16440 [Candidatus Lindowbacteria bacterium RIFCSPLOWO2_02_FULL_62_12]
MGYTQRLKPLHIVTYATTDNKVLKKRAYFEDNYSNVITLTDYVKDGLLPYDDRDGMVDQISLEVYNRGLLMDFFVQDGSIYSDHLLLQKEKSMDGVNMDAIRVLTEKFVHQNDYVKTASVKTEYEIALHRIIPEQAQAVVEVDGQQEKLRQGVLQKVGGVYVLLDRITRYGIKEFDDRLDSGFVVVRIGNQGVLLQAGQRSRISIDPAQAGRKKLLKTEKTNFVFVVHRHDAPDRAQSELEDIFHTFLVDQPGHEHVCYDRIVREMDAAFSSDSSAVSGYKVVEDPFAKDRPAGFAAQVKDQIKTRMGELYQFLSSLTGPTLAIRGFVR